MSKPRNQVKQTQKEIKHVTQKKSSSLKVGCTHSGGVSEDNFRGSACASEWMLISVKDGGLVFHNLRLHKDNKLE
jgi:hypothetical protein